MGDLNNPISEDYRNAAKVIADEVVEACERIVHEAFGAGWVMGFSRGHAEGVKYNGENQSTDQSVVPPTTPEGSGDTGVSGEGESSRHDGRHQLRGQL